MSQASCHEINRKRRLARSCPMLSPEKAVVATGSAAYEVQGQIEATTGSLSLEAGGARGARVL